MIQAFLVSILACVVANYLQIRRRYSEGMGAAALAEAYHLSLDSIRIILR